MTTNNGTIEQVIDLPDRTITITIEERAEETRRKVETTLKKDAPAEAPYTLNSRNRHIEKGRVILPAEWKNHPPKVILYNPTKKTLQIILSSNENLTAPGGWLKVTLSIDKNGNCYRISLGPILNSTSRQKLTHADLLAHGTYFTIVAASAPDIDPTVLKQIRIQQE